MNVFVNNKQEVIPTPATLINLMEKLALSEKKGIAVAVNNTVISKTGWIAYELKENDKIIIIKATQGG